MFSERAKLLTSQRFFAYFVLPLLDLVLYLWANQCQCAALRSCGDITRFIQTNVSYASTLISITSTFITFFQKKLLPSSALFYSALNVPNASPASPSALLLFYCVCYLKSQEKCLAFMLLDKAATVQEQKTRQKNNKYHERANPYMPKCPCSAWSKYFWTKFTSRRVLWSASAGVCDAPQRCMHQMH